MTYIEFVQHCKQKSVVEVEWRWGQTLFNELTRLRPDLAEHCYGNKALDPFYNDKNVPTFLSWLVGVWSSPPAFTLTEGEAWPERKA